MDWKKPVVMADTDMIPFWEALKRHEFVLFRCKKCGAWYWPPAFCRFHDNEALFGNLGWEKASGKGKIFAFNIVYRALHPAYQDELPYCTALIELDEGPMFGTQIIGCDPKEVYIGMPVEVVFEDITKAKYQNIIEEFTLPYCRPIETKKPTHA